ncbi:MAG: hypoxanthine-guanine phosphoribosyltransferase [Gammaproteobacteria bacterium]
MANLSSQELQAVKENSDLIFSASQIKSAIENMGFALEEKINGKNAILVCVMNGGIITTSDLLRSMDCDVRLDYLQVARYRDKTVGGSLHWLKEPQLSLEDQTVVLVDDIYDEGYTMEELVSYCKKHGAKEVITTVLLLKKKSTPQVGRKPDIFGLEVTDRYVYGYGMDYKGYLRNVPAIYAISE